MKILCVDIGTGTQDIFLYDSRLDVENGFKLVVPSPTMMIYRRLQEATGVGTAVALHGQTMGGGPSQWAAETHLRAGYAVYATPAAARSFNDDLDVIRAMGITLVSEDELAALPADVLRLSMRDFDFGAIARALGEFGVALDDLTAVAVGVFDHGNAPPDYSDRLFRFDYIRQRLQAHNRLSAFAYRAADVPPIMTRLQAVAQAAPQIDAPVVVMDTAPAAVLGATLDTAVRARRRVLVANLGNLHTLAFRLGPTGVEGVFEHHTGMLDRPKLDDLLQRLASGTLQHEAVYQDQGHGAYIPFAQPLPLSDHGFGVAVTGPRRGLLVGSALRPYFAVPFGDMMLTGCFGLLNATADLLPDLAPTIRASLFSESSTGVAPWDF
ncbi:MAG: DUF1786 domain-containing protein [Ardenticatenaceae bacterium]|nr:DUF1786 domain-containing protein [Ardenticatenaceae bacterium]